MANATHHPTPKDPDCTPTVDGLEAIRLRLSNFLEQIDRLKLEIDRAFNGQPFIPSLPPSDPVNRHRVRVFLDYHKNRISAGPICGCICWPVGARIWSHPFREAKPIYSWPQSPQIPEEK